MGVAGVEAEAEVLSAISLLLQRLGLGPQDIVIKVVFSALCMVLTQWPGMHRFQAMLLPIWVQ